MTSLDAALAAVKAAGYEVRRPKGRETYEGILTVRRTRKLRGNSFGALLADAHAPRYYAEPSAWIQYPKTDDHPRGWQVRFKRLPKPLHECDGHRVRVVCTPEPWSNGLGLYATRPTAKCLDVGEHVLSALGKMGG